MKTAASLHVSLHISCTNLQKMLDIYRVPIYYVDNRYIDCRYNIVLMMKVNLYQLYRIRCVGRVDMNAKIRTD